MNVLNSNLNITLTALVALVMFSLPATGVEETRLNQLFAQLAQAESVDAGRIAGEIDLELSKSGSPAMDLLLKRGEDALDAGDLHAAIGHLTALTDHAPDFAEGWHTRSLAYAHSGLYGPAIADIERALALRPRHFRAIFGLGVIFEELNRPKQALEAYQRLEAIHPHYEDLAEILERLTAELGGEEI